MLHIFTSAALNYLPKVRQLTESIRHYHPEARIHLALADVWPDDLPHDASFDSIISVADLDIPDWRAWAFQHQLVELATAIKPFVLERLLENDGDRVIYLDPDTVLYDRLDDVLARLDDASVGLTPHLVHPEREEMAILDNEMSALKHGIYNLGFVAVAATDSGRAFARWWRDRCARWCIDDIPNGLFTDQRWVDLAPALFDDVTILRSPRLNVAPWNLAHRPITRHDGHYWVGDERLGFYHFTGFDSGAHHVMAQRYASDDDGAAHAMIEHYRQRSLEAARDPLSQRPWAFARFDDGSPIAKPQRRLYRARADLQQHFPDPFAADGYLNWWRANGEAELAAMQASAGGSMAEKRRAALSTLLRHPSSWRGYARRVTRVWQNEGWQGIKRRLHG